MAARFPVNSTILINKSIHKSYQSTLHKWEITKNCERPRRAQNKHVGHTSRSRSMADLKLMKSTIQFFFSHAHRVKLNTHTKKREDVGSINQKKKKKKTKNSGHATESSVTFDQSVLATGAAINSPKFSWPLISSCTMIYSF